MSWKSLTYVLLSTSLFSTGLYLGSIGVKTEETVCRMAVVEYAQGKHGASISTLTLDADRMAVRLLTVEGRLAVVEQRAQQHVVFTLKIAKIIANIMSRMSISGDV